MTYVLTTICLGGALVALTFAAFPSAVRGALRSRHRAFLVVFAAMMLHAATDKPDDALKVVYTDGLRPDPAAYSVGTNDVAYIHWTLAPDFAKGGGPVPGDTPVVVVYALDDDAPDPDWEVFSSNEVVAADMRLEKSTRGTPLVGPIGAPDANHFKYHAFSLYVPPPDVITNLVLSGRWVSDPGSPIVPVGAVFTGDTNSVSPPAIRREP